MEILQYSHYPITYQPNIHSITENFIISLNGIIFENCENPKIILSLNNPKFFESILSKNSQKGDSIDTTDNKEDYKNDETCIEILCAAESFDSLIISLILKPVIANFGIIQN